MARTTTKKMIFGFVMMVITVLLGCCSATVYKIGDSDGWISKEDIYYDWAEHKEFHVGDSLVFEFDRNLNDVTQVPGGLEYEFYNFSSPKAIYNIGHDVVTLMESGYHYIITSNHAQCMSRHKLDVLVTYDPSSPIPPPPPSKILPFGKVYKVDDSKGWSVYDINY